MRRFREHEGALRPLLFLFALSVLLRTSVLSAAPDGTPATMEPRKGASCLQIFYDEPANASHVIGVRAALLATNLLGHFPDIEVIRTSVDSYEAGSLERCPWNIYFGTYFRDQLPPTFLGDARRTKTRLLWIGYSPWFLGEDFPLLWGLRGEQLAAVRPDLPDPRGEPGFFRNVLYRGEAFRKFGTWSADGGRYVAQGDVFLVRPATPDTVVLAEIEHSSTHELRPYLSRRANFFYCAENPFTYMHEGDRMLVFADFLFDFLDQPPRRRAPLALLRLEDIHPLTPPRLLTEALQVIEEENARAHLSVIPIFRDPLRKFPALPVEASLDPESPLARELRDAQARGHGILWHGVTHQLEARTNPFSGVTGDDFEFWDAVRNAAPVSETATELASRFARGRDLLERAGLSVDGWVTPHYGASPLAARFIAHETPANIGRVGYFDGLGGASAGNIEGAPFGQIFPYEIDRDLFGQRVFPENLGYVGNGAEIGGRSVDAMLEDARRNLVLRDAWASAFFHPYLLGKEIAPGWSGAQELRRLVAGLRRLGYQFIRLTAGSLRSSPPNAEMLPRPRSACSLRNPCRKSR